jgi:hypothetical protein
LGASKKQNKGKKRLHQNETSQYITIIVNELELSKKNKYININAYVAYIKEK